MVTLQTKLTSQSQVSIPAPIRNALGIKPGSVIEWTLEGDKIVVRRASKWSSEEIHRAIFPELNQGELPTKTLAQLRQGLRDHIKRRHAGD